VFSSLVQKLVSTLAGVLHNATCNIIVRANNKNCFVCELEGGGLGW
jgi:hypothetical protein